MTDTTRTARRLAVGLALFAALTGCSTSSDPTPAAAPSSSAPAPLPSQDWNQQACTALPTGMLEILNDLGDTRKAAESAAKSSDDLMRQHGRKLLNAVTARETADLNSDRNAAVDANLDISRAALDMAEACSALYGDGNW